MYYSMKRFTTALSYVGILLLLSTLAIHAQSPTTGTITGKVIDGGVNEPLRGASVLVVGTKKGAY